MRVVTPRSPTALSRAAALVALVGLLLALVPASAAGTPAVTDTVGHAWRWPVAGDRHVVDPFRAPAHAYGPGHRGMDIAAPVGTAVRVPAAGVVAFRGTVVDRPLLTVDHGGGLVTTWEPLDSALQPGDTVDAGSAIGTVATGGHAAAHTLHIGLRVDGVYTNPLPLFGAVPRAVLLPCCDD